MTKKEKKNTIVLASIKITRSLVLSHDLGTWNTQACSRGHASLTPSPTPAANDTGTLGAGTSPPFPPTFPRACHHPSDVGFSTSAFSPRLTFPIPARRRRGENPPGSAGPLSLTETQAKVPRAGSEGAVLHVHRREGKEGEEEGRGREG